ncbi:MAG: MBL fold metallo-hydrolase, partial [Hyphomicrobiaceae bacterium]
MKITWFGHSCFRIETGGSVILIDPFLTGNPKFEASGVAKEQATKGVTHVALTHGHDDHI